MLHRLILLIVSILALASALASAEAGVIFGNDGLIGGYRWDAAPNVFDDNERSLDGGLRYSLQGGSLEAYRDQFQWFGGVAPSVADFQLAVEQAFAAWTAVDPVTGLHTSIFFVADLTTEVVGSGMFNGANSNGAEIDLLAIDAGDAQVKGRTGINATGQAVTLTSGTTVYPGSFAFTGIDITINNNSGAMHRLPQFRRLLTHEIGHALGLSDVEVAADEAVFIDDNYDGSTSATALATLTNPWALRVDPYDPAASPLNLYTVANADPGIKTSGVNLLMESSGLGISDPGNPVTNLVPLTNDEYATRQFLYPSLTRDIVVTGDYNGNGIVDAGDYTVWRDTFGQTVFWHGDGADGDQNGTIDAGDYIFWKERFGDVISTAPTASFAVPEPATLLLLVVTLLVVSNAESRRWHRRSCYTSGFAGQRCIN